ALKTQSAQIALMEGKLRNLGVNDDISAKSYVYTFILASPIASSSKQRTSRPQSITSHSSSTGGGNSDSKLIDLHEAQRKLTAARKEKIPAGIGLPDLTNRKCIDVN